MEKLHSEQAHITTNICQEEPSIGTNPYGPGGRVGQGERCSIGSIGKDKQVRNEQQLRWTAKRKELACLQEEANERM